MADMNNTRLPEESGAEEKSNRARARRAPKRGGRRFRGINLFDLLIIFVILAVIGLLIGGVRMTDLLGNETPAGNETLVYQIRLCDIDQRFAGSIAVGDSLQDAETGAMLGTVTGTVDITPHRVAVAATGDNGLEAQWREVEGRVDITLTVTTGAALHTAGTGYTVEDRAIRIGETYTLRFPNYTANGTCTRLGAGE